ncbi:MAG: DNA cytosine methyltransferase [Roseiflexaceae bacterium]
MDLKNCSVVDMFCGAGGLTHGFFMEGFRVLAGLDNDITCKYVYETNNRAKFLQRNIEAVTVDEVRSYYPKNHAKILIGCAPCQPFSSYTKQYRSTTTKWQLVDTFINLIVESKPDIVSMENVPELISFRKGEIFASLVKKLENAGYNVTYYKVYCPDYGIPQTRTRLVLFASIYGKVDLIAPTHKTDDYVTVKNVIGDLPTISAGETHILDELHRSSALSSVNLERIRQSIPGGTWRDWEPQLIAKCHRKKTGESYDGVYGRMKWNAPAPTITTQCNGYGNGRFGHPEQDRAISMREAAIFQTFPKDYLFFPPGTKWNIGTIARLIGNAVPVMLGQVIAQSIKKHL